MLESILRAPDPSAVQTAQEQDSDDEDATATLSNIKHSAADVRDWVVRVHSEEALLEVLHEEQRHQQEAMAGRATSALRLLIQEDTCSEEGRRLVEALQAHD